MSMYDAARNANSRIDSIPAGPGQQESPDEGKQPMAAVHYRPADDPQRSCGRCQYADGLGGCALVAGQIQPQDTCDLFSPGTPGQSAGPMAAPPAATLPPPSAPPMPR